MWTKLVWEDNMPTKNVVALLQTINKERFHSPYLPKANTIGI